MKPRSILVVEGRFVGSYRRFDHTNLVAVYPSRELATDWFTQRRIDWVSVNKHERYGIVHAVDDAQLIRLCKRLMEGIAC